MKNPIRIEHNFDPKAFMWLWAKYVRQVNDAQHCTHVLRGPYSKKLSAHNDRLRAEGTLLFDEAPLDSFKAIYICGVARKGYSRKENYEHNVHLPILPAPGETTSWSFENWTVRIYNGRVLTIPTQAELPPQYSGLPDEFTTCRIFRWAVTSEELAG